MKDLNSGDSSPPMKSWKTDVWRMAGIARCRYLELGRTGLPWKGRRRIRGRYQMETGTDPCGRMALDWRIFACLDGLPAHLLWTGHRIRNGAFLKNGLSRPMWTMLKSMLICLIVTAARRQFGPRMHKGRGSKLLATLLVGPNFAFIRLIFKKIADSWQNFVMVGHFRATYDAMRRKLITPLVNFWLGQRIFRSLTIWKNLVGLSNLLELLFGRLFILGVLVGVPFQG